MAPFFTNLFDDVHYLNLDFPTTRSNVYIQMVGGYPEPKPCLYKIGKELGKGTYSIVQECEHVETGMHYAAKIIDKKLMHGREHLVRNEVVVLRRTSAGNSNVLTLVDYFETDDKLYLVTELCRGGELFDRIYERGALPEPEAARIVRAVVTGINYLHENGVVHRDLKPENVLFKEKTNTDDALRIADFGLSRIVDEERLAMLMTTCGTPSYMAPEIFTKQGHAKQVDIWAVGVLAFFTVCGYTPFDRDTAAEERSAIMSADYAFENPSLSAEAQDFVNRCLRVDPAERPTARECLEHEFLRNVQPQETKPNFDAPSTLIGAGMHGAYSEKPLAI